MFKERDDKASRTEAVLTMNDGSVSIVLLKLSLTSRMADTLNNPDRFLDIQTLGGEQQFIAKSSIRMVRFAAIPKAEQLAPEPSAAAARANFDPYSILGVKKDAAPEEIRQAYYRMAKIYHPDRINAYELPEEVKQYVRDMLVRINLAFEQLGQ